VHEAVSFDEESLRARLLNLAAPCSVVQAADGRLGMVDDGLEHQASPAMDVLAHCGPLPPERLGDPAFHRLFGVRLAYAAGAMANGIASEELVTALGRSGILSSFGAAGLVPARLETAIQRIKAALPDGPFAFNLIHSPNEPALERGTVELYLRHGITTVEASAFLDLTPHLVRYRAAGLRTSPRGEIEIGNRLIVKLSRHEVAEKVMRPAPPEMLAQLVREGTITDAQAGRARRVPLCDAVTVEADSGGHTDNRPLACLLPSILGLRNAIQAEMRYRVPVMAGGIGTPEAVVGAFAMGAAYVVTGSVNQSCRESGTSTAVRALLAQATMVDVIMAPSADMFELGVKVQLLKRGTVFPLRAQKLFDLYREYDSLDALPVAEREQLERRVFRQSLDSIWQETVRFFEERDPSVLAQAADNPKRKMALIFRWYLGLSSRWSIAGKPGREQDYQIWCGPSMGAYNDWVCGSYLEDPAGRSVVDVAHHLMHGAAYLTRLHQLRLQGVQLPDSLARYRPVPI
jgi:trans-AT polyketide synthase, acyltransferase and oxidoreductase domains